MADFQTYAPSICATPCRTHPLCICTSIERQRALLEGHGLVAVALQEISEWMGQVRDALATADANFKAVQKSLTDLIDVERGNTGRFEVFKEHFLRRLATLEQEMGLRRADEPATERDEPAGGEVVL